MDPLIGAFWALVDMYVVEFIHLEMAAFHVRSRLEAQADPVALHDLRIVIRRLRSLLTPLKKVSAELSYQERRLRDRSVDNTLS